jgi:hypothetical protein
MIFFAIGSYHGFGPWPDIGPVMRWICVAIVIGVVISLIVNRKKLDEINRDATSKDEPPKVIGSPWKCSKFGEMSEPQFDACWKCGTARKGEHVAKQD